MFEDILEQAGLGDKTGDLLGMLGQHVESKGGVGGLVEGFTEQGLQEEASSWVGTGENKPVSSDQVQTALGGDFITHAAQKLGVDPGAIGGVLAKVLPQLVDKLTPGGKIPEGNPMGDLLKGISGGNIPDLGSILGGFSGQNEKS